MAARSSIAREVGFVLSHTIHHNALIKRGTDWSIVELNGVTSESTNLYDPSWSLLDAYRTLARQWRLAFAIGSLNRARGQPVTRLTSLIGEISSYYRHRRVSLLSD